MIALIMTTASWIALGVGALLIVLIIIAAAYLWVKNPPTLANSSVDGDESYGED